MTGGFVYLPDSFSDVIVEVTASGTFKSIPYPGAYEWLRGIYNSGKPVVMLFKVEGVKTPMLFDCNKQQDAFVLSFAKNDANILIDSFVDHPNTLTFSIAQA